MTTTTAQYRPAKAGTFFERLAWKGLFGVCLLLGFFGIGDMLNGTSDLQNGEKVYMTRVTGMTWNDWQAESPNVARMIDTIFRTNGAAFATASLLFLVICLTGFRKGER